MSECLSGKDLRCQVRIKLKHFHAKVQHFFVSPILLRSVFYLNDPNHDFTDDFATA